jgi:hypothetical protein
MSISYGLDDDHDLIEKCFPRRLFRSDKDIVTALCELYENNFTSVVFSDSDVIPKDARTRYTLPTRWKAVVYMIGMLHDKGIQKDIKNSISNNFSLRPLVNKANSEHTSFLGDKTAENVIMAVDSRLDRVERESHSDFMRLEAKMDAFARSGSSGLVSRDLVVARRATARLEEKMAAKHAVFREGTWYFPLRKHDKTCQFSTQLSIVRDPTKIFRNFERQSARDVAHLMQLLMQSASTVSPF